MTALLVSLLVGCAADPNKPPALNWDHDACSDCGMLVSEPAHASAIITRDGKTLPFDDPGCLFRYTLKNHPAIAAMWFYDGTNWYREDEVGFTEGAKTPMGSGLQAVPKSTPGALTVGEASSLVVSGGK